MITNEHTAICTTLNKIRECVPYVDKWQDLLSHLGKTAADDEPLPLLTVLDVCGLDDALRCLRTVPRYRAMWRHYAVDCAGRVWHLLIDDRSREALRMARRHALGLVEDLDLGAALVDARAAAWTGLEFAGAARGTHALASARAALAVKNAAEVESAVGVRLAAENAALAAGEAAAADAAFETERDAARVAARRSERAWQTARLRKLLTDGAWSPVEAA
jgi:hypothetical protein